MIVLEIFYFYNDKLEIRIDDIFVNEYINKEGNRVFESVWFLNEQVCMESHKFTTSLDYDASPWSKNIKRWVLTKSNFDFNVAREDSRVNLEFNFATDVTGAFKASRENCVKLIEIMKKYIIPNALRP